MLWCALNREKIEVYTTRGCITLAMFHWSTQKDHWLFKGEEDLERLRAAANSAYCEKASNWSDLGGAIYYSDACSAACEGGGGERRADVELSRGTATLPVLY